MGGYKVIMAKSALKELYEISKKDLERILLRIGQLSQNPRGRGSEKLSSRRESYRLRQGDYRIVYSVNDKDRIVDVSKIGHRKEIYKSRVHEA
jgi:mRNA interferase RelE/StbE